MSICNSEEGQVSDWVMYFVVFLAVFVIGIGSTVYGSYVGGILFIIMGFVGLSVLLIDLFVYLYRKMKHTRKEEEGIELIVQE